MFLVGDGMADYPLKELGGKTPLEAAETPHMDIIASCRLGLVRTISPGMDPGSDIASLSLLGYEPRIYHTGRAPLEAASIGVRLQPNHLAFRMNLVTLDWRADDEIIMVSHSSGDITNEEAAQIVETLKQRIKAPEITIYPGVAYRHLLVWEDGPEEAVTFPPHDHLDQNMAHYLNHSSNNPVPGLIRSSWEILKQHPVNMERRRSDLKEANSIWLWGQGKAPKLPPFPDKYGMDGGVIAAVDLIKGIGISAGLTPIHVEGATGYLDTNYQGKADEGLKGLENLDFIFLHVEAPDEAGHNGNYKEKIQAIEDFDQKVVGTVLKGLSDYEDYHILVASDHFTPISKRTHTREPTPFAWANKKEIESATGGIPFTEEAARKSGLLFEEGHQLMSAFLSDD